MMALITTNRDQFTFFFLQFFNPSNTACQINEMIHMFDDHSEMKTSLLVYTIQCNGRFCKITFNESDLQSMCMRCKKNSFSQRSGLTTCVNFVFFSHFVPFPFHHHLGNAYCECNMQSGV